MDKNRHHQQSGNGFLLGVIVGVVITLLFTTKKGRKILRSLTEEGQGRFTELEAILTGEGGRMDPAEKTQPTYPREEESEEMAGDDFLEPEVKSEKRLLSMHPAVRKSPTAGRRYFRGVPKKS